MSSPSPSRGTPATDPELAIHADGLARRFGSRWVLRGVSLGVQRGEVVGLLGANGSGKTTLLRILSTLLGPTAGSASVLGADVAREPDAVRRHIGYLGHQPGLYDDLTARENLRFAAEMCGVPSTGVDGLLDRVGLASVAQHRVRGFSAGMQRRLALARLMLGKPRVLLLDEPYSNLDTAAIAITNTMIDEVCRSGGAALLVLHEIAPAASLLHRTCVVVDGRIAPPGQPAEGSPRSRPVSAVEAC